MNVDKKNALIVTGVFGVIVQIPYLLHADLSLFLLYAVPYIIAIIIGWYFGPFTGLLLATFGMLTVDVIVLVELVLNIHEPWSLLFNLLSMYKLLVIFPILVLVGFFYDNRKR